jgi:polyisoprenyl-phosphate glycosyltransferase
VIVLDADLQDPPEVVLDLAKRWREGYDVVYAVREEREGETRFKRSTAAAFYRGFSRISEVQVPIDVGDFRLVDRRALDVFNQMRESNRFVRGMFAWIGLRQTGVTYTRQERFAGQTKYPLRRMLGFAATGVISFSSAPLRAALNLGFVVSGVAFGFGIWSVIVKLTDLYDVPGWTSIVVVTTLIGGVQLIVLGVIGEYVGDIHDEVKRRPLYVIGELENFPGRAPAAAAGDRRRQRARVRARLVAVGEGPRPVGREGRGGDDRERGQEGPDLAEPGRCEEHYEQARRAGPSGGYEDVADPRPHGVASGEGPAGVEHVTVDGPDAPRDRGGEDVPGARRQQEPIDDERDQRIGDADDQEPHELATEEHGRIVCSAFAIRAAGCYVVQPCVACSWSASPLPRSLPVWRSTPSPRWALRRRTESSSRRSGRGSRSR